MGKWIAIGFLIVLLISIIVIKRGVIIIHFQRLFKKKRTTQDPINTYNFDLIGRYYHNSIEKKKYYHTINNSIANDLDIDDVFQFIDRTSSKIGQQFLYAKIRTIGDIKELKQFDDFADQLQKEKESSQFIKSHLEKLSDSDGYLLERLIHEPLINHPYARLARILAFSFIIILGIGLFYPFLFLLLLPIFIVNLILYYNNKSNIAYYSSAIHELSKTLRVAKKVSTDVVIKDQHSDLSFINDIDKIRRKLWMISPEKIESNDLMLPLVVVSDLVKIALNIELISFSNLISNLESKQPNIEKLFRFIGQIDSALSVAYLRAEDMPMCKPTFSSQKEINVENIVHPLIESCISNSITLNNKSLLLTGSNMSGKTTFIRTISINSILAQTIYTVFAKQYTAPFFKLFSSIRISDDLMQETSYYLKEVLTIKDFIAASQSKEQCLFVLDEIFKGTNTIERISAGKAILQYLNKNNHLVIVSTHDVELAELLENSNYSLYHFCEEIVNGNLLFNYQLKEGRLKTRNAIKILELYNYPEEIIDDARNTENFLD